MGWGRGVEEEVTAGLSPAPVMGGKGLGAGSPAGWAALMATMHPPIIWHSPLVAWRRPRGEMIYARTRRTASKSIDPKLFMILLNLNSHIF